MADRSENITQLIESIDTIDNEKVAIEPTVDTDTGVKSFGYKDSDGNARRCLTTDSPNLLDAEQYAELTKFTQTFSLSGNVPSDIGTVLFNASGNMDMTLLSADASNEGSTFTFKDYALNAETYTLKILTQGSETIDGEADFTFTKNGQAVTLRAYSSDWHIVGDAKAVTGGASSVATSNDSTTTLTILSQGTIIASGAGVNHQIDLGDATTYAVGLERKIVNASSEIIGVVNSDNTAWERLQPNCTLFAVLVDNSAAAGVWNIRKTNIQLRDGQSVSNLFQTGAGLIDNSSLALKTITGGIGSRVIINAYENGVARLESGTDVDSFVFVYGTNTFANIDEGPHQLVANIAVNALSDGVDDYILKAGFVSSVTVPTQTNEMVIEYDYSGNGNVQSWFSRTRSSAAATSTTTLGQAPQAGLASNTSVSHTVIVEVSSDGARADFYISGTTAHVSETANINTGVVYYPFVSMEKVLGTTEKTAGLEAIGLNRVLGTKRW